VILGDSLTFGWGVEKELTFEERLEARLDETRPTEVINLGVGNYNTTQQVHLFLAKGLKYQPDQVVLFYFINDAEPVPQQSTLPWLGSSRLITFYWSRIQALRADRRYDFMFAGLSVKDSMAEVLARLLRIPVEGRPITILQLSGVPSEIVDVVVSLLCRMVFDFAMWSMGQQSVPVLLVCEEAHRYIPQDQDTGFAPTRKAIARIAKEGRKYGVSLCLVTQRPSELSETILSQCNTIFTLRMSNERDQVFVRRAMPDSAAGMLNALPALRNQECIVVGEGVSVPMRIRFLDLEPYNRPQSDTAIFSDAWEYDQDRGESFLHDVVDRWRRQSF